jgi:hypothetical protein
VVHRDARERYTGVDQAFWPKNEESRRCEGDTPSHFL